MEENTVKVRVELDTNPMERGRQEGVTRARVAAQEIDKEFLKSARDRLREHQSLEKQRTREYMNEARARMRQEQDDERTMRNYNRQRLSEEKQRAREVERINRETARQAAEHARTRERAARQLADAETRAARRSADEMLRNLRRMRSEGERSAKDTGGSFSTYLGAGFFGALGASAVHAFYSRAKDFVSEGIKIASETQNALKGVTVEAKFRGINPSDVQDSIKNLRLVRAGILSVGDGATTVKNLLSSGFGLKQAVEITERFSDASAFGKQAALEHGTAIARASEGIKNQNSQLVDNVGLTKNLSVILKERGYQLEDLSNKVKGAAAREALYQGIMAETASQVGNADKLMQGYSGTVAGNEQAWRNLQATVGLFITQSPSHVEAMRIQAEQLRALTGDIGNADSETARFARNTLYAWDSLKSQAVPFAAFMGNSFMAAGSSVASALNGMLAVLTKFIETAVNGVVNGAKTGVNSLIESVNTVTNLARKIPTVLPNSPLGYLQAIPEIKKFETSNNAFLGSDKFKQRTFEYAESFIQYRSAADRAIQEGGQVRERLAQASRRPRAGEVALPSPVADALSTVRERGLPVSALGQSRTHQRLGLDHRGAFDVAVSPSSEAGRRIIRYLEENGIDYRAITARDIARGVKGTGEHIHIGAASRSIYRKVQKEVAADKARQFIAARISQLPQQLTTTANIREDGISKRLTTDEAALLESNKRYAEQGEELYNRQKNFAHELRRVWSQAALDRQQRELDTLRDIEQAEAALYHLRDDAANKGASEQRRMLLAKHEELDLTSKLIQLQDEYANSGVNDTLRQQVVLHEELLALRQRDGEAIESQIRSQVRLADQSVFHSEQARAKILEHMATAKGYTDIVSDAFISASDGIGDAMSSLFGRVNRGLGRFGEILTDIETSLLKMVTNRLLMRLVDGLLGSNTGGSASSVGGFNPLSILTGARGGFPMTATTFPQMAGGFNMFAPAGIASVFGNQFGGSNLTRFDTFSGQAQSNAWLTQAGSPVFSAAGGAASGSGLIASLRGALPLLGGSLGLGIGGSLGGQSRAGRLIGSLAGGAAGLAGGLAGFAALGGTFGTGTLGSLLGGIAGAALPIAAVAAPLLIGAMLLGRNAQRRKDETLRNQLTLDANGSLDQLIRQVRNHQTDPASALSQAAEIRSNYLQQAGQLKDKKARSHALLTVRELDYRIVQLRSAATTALNDNGRRNITSAFATGGVVSGQRGEPRLILAHGGEIVASLANQTPEFVQAAANAGIPAVRSSGEGAKSVAPVVKVEFLLGTDAQNRLFVNGIESDAGFDSLVKGFKTARKYGNV